MPVLILILLLAQILPAGPARAAALVMADPDRRAAEVTRIGGGELALAGGMGAGVGAAAASLGGDVLLAVGLTVILVEIGILILEATVIGGAIYFWPESEPELLQLGKPPERKK